MIHVAACRSPTAGKLDTVSSPSMARFIPADLPCGYLSETPHAATTTCRAPAITPRESVMEPGVFISTGSTHLQTAAVEGAQD